MKKELSFELCIYAISVALAGLFWRRPAILGISYVIISMIMLIKWHEKSDLIFYFVAFSLGPIGEAFAIYLGAWQFLNSVACDDFGKRSSFSGFGYGQYSEQLG